MLRAGSRRLRPSVITLLFLFGLSACGGGGGGFAPGSGGGGITPSQEVTNSLKAFSVACTKNDEAAATNLFAEDTMDRSLRVWRSLTNEQKIFFGKAIAEGASIPNVSDIQSRVDVEITVLDMNDNPIHINLVLVRSGKNGWKIRTW